ncbi:MAG: hypothetical protein H0Z19_11735 [Archaeoglobus sp.]|uniref:phage tail assembly protein n=1 Tax=Archaeoglobus sp. TaxID=1872626 RepID=UPI001D1F6B0D|nr:phage tail assembly protein [Archaeoglobus sp.]MBO8181119.1 hypothetical protein [Archaeoglobus sp.]
MEKKVTINGREFTAREPAGYEVDRFIVEFLDDNMQPIREKIPEANVALIKMVFGLSEEEIKQLPNSVYRKLTEEAGNFIVGMNEDEQKK